MNASIAMIMSVMIERAMQPTIFFTSTAPMMMAMMQMM